MEKNIIYDGETMMVMGINLEQTSKGKFLSQQR